MGTSLEHKVKIVRKLLRLPSTPFLRAVRFVRILGSPSDWMRRRHIARRISKTSQYADCIDKQKGYRLFGPTDFPGIMEAVQASNEVYRKRSKTANLVDSKKLFFANILEQSDLERHPDLLAFAKSRPILEAVTDYLGTLPELRAIGVYLSPANKFMKSSQKFHVDRNDLRQIKCFINVHAVNSENGPFTFIPADRTRELRRKLGHQSSWNRIEDKDVQSLCEPGDVISLTGGPGTGAMVDSSSCLHFGSRCRVGHRLVLMFQYTRQPDAWLKGKEYYSQKGLGLHGMDDRGADAAANG